MQITPVGVHGQGLALLLLGLLSSFSANSFPYFQWESCHCFLLLVEQLKGEKPQRLAFLDGSSCTLAMSHV